MTDIAHPGGPGPAAPDNRHPVLRWRGHLLALASVLVAVPAVINAGYDIYAAVRKMPRTEAERVNEELFRKYFGKAPVAVMPVPIQHTLGTVEARFSVYQEGDVFVEYGKQTQWFRFPRAANGRELAFSVLATAHAQPTAPATAQPKIHSQSLQVDGNAVLRTRIYDNGVVEKSEIDLRSGAVLHKAVEQAQPLQAVQEQVRIISVPAIELGKPAVPMR